MAILTRFAQAFRTPDLRKKLLFTLGIIALFRFGSALPVPGISAANVLIMVGVGLDTVKQIESQLQQRHYEGFLRQPARPARPGGELAGTAGGPAALTVS